MPSQLDPNERIRLKRLAALSQGRSAKGGKLILTDQRLLFRPGLRNRIFGAVELALPRSAIDEVQVEPQRAGLFTGGLRHRIVVTLKDGTEHRFAVNRPQAVASAIRAALAGANPN